MKVLVVDDSRVMRHIVIRALRQSGLGADVVQAEDGAKGLAAARSEHPDLVLSDWNMPVMDGLDLLRALRAHDPAVRFGFVTSECSPQMRETAAAAGASFLLSKPFSPQCLADAVVAALGVLR